MSNTGLAPADHQSYFGTRLVDGTYTLRPRYQSDLRGTPFWRELAAHRRRLVLMDVPFSRVDAACGGTQIVGWGHHEWGGPRESHPARLLARVEREFGRYPIAPSVEDAWARGGPGGLLHGLLQGIERRTRILHHLAGANDWESFYGVFHEAHVPVTTFGTSRMRPIRASMPDFKRDTAMRFCGSTARWINPCKV